MVMNFIAPGLSVEIVVGQGPWCVYTELTEGSSNNIHYPALDKSTVYPLIHRLTETGVT